MPVKHASPVPPIKLGPSLTIAYMYRSEQKDRKRNILRIIFLSEEKIMKNPKMMAMNDRDSVRLATLIPLYNDSAIVYRTDKFKAGMIFLHGGGSKMTADTLYEDIAYKLFSEVYNTPPKKYKKAAAYFMEQSRLIKAEYQQRH